LLHNDHFRLGGSGRQVLSRNRSVPTER
jgi:hypothetical protein